MKKLALKKALLCSHAGVKANRINFRMTAFSVWLSKPFTHVAHSL